MNNIKEQIRAEIEQRKEFYKTLATAAAEKNLHNTMEANELLVRQCDSLLAFIDSLTDEQPSKDLDDEVHRFFEDCIDVHDAKIYGVNERVIPVVCYELTARHFAKWGEENAYKTIMKKADEVRDKKFDTDYEVKFEPAAGFDSGCVNVYHKDKLVGQYVEPKEEKPSQSLEEAAEEYEKNHTYQRYDGGGFTPEYNATLAEAFQAGAQWQAKQGYSLEYVIRYAWGVSDTSTESKKATLSFPLPADIYDGDRVIIQIRKK